MRNVTRAIALLGGLALSGLLFTPAAIAADLEAVVEEPAGIGWYVSLFGGPKWGDGEVNIKDIRRENDQCQIPYLPASFVVCEVLDLVIVDSHEAALHGEIDNGFLFGGAIGTQLTENLRAEIEVSHARLDTETDVEYYVRHGGGGGTGYSASDEDRLRELFILANFWFGFPISEMFSPYLGGGIGAAHVDAEFGVQPFAVNDTAPPPTFSASLEADSWNFAYQLGAGVLIGLSENIAIDLGYRFKVIPNVDLDDPKFCDGHCYPGVEDFKADDDFDIHEHVAQIGITIGF
jgi:opacity protein-like surface antigen